MKKFLMTSCVAIVLAGACYGFFCSDAFIPTILKLDARRQGFGIGQQPSGPHRIAYMYSENTSTAKEPVIYVHGFSGFKEAQAAFLSHFDQYAVYALDLPGHGYTITSDEEYSYSVDNMVATIHDFAVQQGLNKFHLIGHSMGGAITLCHALTFPDDLLSATVIAPGSIDGKKLSALHSLDAEKRLKLSIPESFDLFKQKLRMAHADSDALGAPDWLLKRFWLEDQRHYPAYRNFLKHFSRDNLLFDRQSLSGICVPLLVVWGKQDRFCDPSGLRTIEEAVPHANTVMFEHVGHNPPMEDPVSTARAITEFYRRLGN